MSRRNLGSSKPKLANIVEDTTPQLGGDLDLNGKNIDFPTTANISDCLDEDTMSSDSATMLATQQSIKAYADNLPKAFRLGGDMVVNSGDADAIDVTAGSWRDLADSENIVFTAFTAKQLDNTWAVGDTAGMLDTGAIAGATTYFIFAIKRTDTDVVDILASLSDTAPTMPTSYTIKRRIGAVATNATPDIIPFFQVGTEFVLDIPVVSDNSANPGTSARTITTSAPVGIVVNSVVSYSMIDTSGASPTYFLATALAQTDTVPAIGVNDFQTKTSAEANGVVKRVRTNASAQVRVRASADTADHTHFATTLGWIDDLLDAGV